MTSEEIDPDRLMILAQEIEESAASAEHQQQSKPDAKGSGSYDGGTRTGADYQDSYNYYHNRVQNIFYPFSRIPNPSSYDSAIEDLRAAMARLSRGEHLTVKGGDQDAESDINKDSIAPNEDLDNLINSSPRKLNSWHGEAADKFKDNFLDHLSTTASHHFLSLSILKNALEADRAVWSATLKDINKIGEDTKDALDNLTSKNKNDLEFALSVITALTGILTVGISSGAGLVLTTISVATSTADDADNGAGLSGSQGGSASKIIRSMESAIKTLTEKVQDQQTDIANALTQSNDKLNDSKSSVYLPRPKLTELDDDELISNKGLGEHD